jgi:thiopeptide-type bacteriocin biosynthesis protein
MSPPPPFSPSGFFAFRTPLLPAAELARLGAGLAGDAAAAGADDAALAAALAADRALVRARLRALVLRPDVREAIFVASPSLDESMAAWLESPDGERGQKVERTLVRYIARMAGRATPFGLFAGCSIGVLGGAPAAETRLTVAESARYERHTRLDMDYVCALTEKLARDPALRADLSFRPNSSLYRSGGRLRYAESRISDGGAGVGGRSRSYHLVAVDASDYLEATLERARDGARPRDLAAALAEDPEVTTEEAAGFVDELIDSGVLVSDLDPAVTGPEPIHALVATLAAHGGAAATGASRLLAETRDAIDALDAHGVGGNGARPYREIAARLEGLPAPVELPRLFQVDMVKPAPGATLGQAAVRDLGRAVELLHRLSPHGPGEVEGLRQFRERFQARYETRAVPLAVALDEEAGIGYEKSDAPGAEASPLLEGLAFAGAPASSNQVAWNAREGVLLELLLAAARDGRREIALEEADVARMERSERARLPRAFAVMGTLFAASPEAAARGEHQLFVNGAPGPSGATLLGRFCHADPALEAHVRAHLAAEEALRPDAIFAEIVHLPEGRIGNVIARPVLRGHEIVFLGRSGAPAEQQIALTDLWVSVEHGRVVLRSERLGAEIVPCLTNAHNTAHPRNLSVYRFLAALGRQGAASVAWSWGALEGAPFLPRVTALGGRVILALARWRVPKRLLEPLVTTDATARFRAARALRVALGLPRWVALVDGDNELPVDLENVLSVDTFAQLVKDRGAARLEEILPFDASLCAVGPEGAFVHELVVPFVRKQPDPPPPAVRRAPSDGRRSFAPGSEWLFAKLYTGPATADQVLREAVAPLVAELESAGIAQRWFFIRYGDPDWHLRLRFRAAPEAQPAVLAALHRHAAPLLEDGRVHKLALDTYEREVERYGGPEGIELSEALFHADSAACLAIVDTLSGDEGADARWRLTLRGLDLLLDDLGLDLDGKRAVAGAAREGFAREMNAKGTLERQLGERFRRLRGDLEKLLAAPVDPEDWLGPGLEALARRSVAQRAVAETLRAAEREGRLTATMRDLAPSYMHMHVNRMARAAARAQELVLYDFLARLYEGRAARARKTR